MKLTSEKGALGRYCHLLPDCNVPVHEIGIGRERELNLPEFSENETSRHYTGLARRTHSINDGFYPLGSCAMRYNPEVSEEAAPLEGFAGIHPLQPEYTIQGALKVFGLAEKYLCGTTGMKAMTLQPMAGAHGEFTDLLLVEAHHRFKGDEKRTEIVVPDSAHSINSANAAMAGYSVISIPSREDRCVDLNKPEEAVGEDTVGLMPTNPNTVGLFDKDILEIVRIVHEARGLCYHDGANLNAVMGIVRPGDMGFDVIHLNFHKVFSTPHGGGGSESDPVGCKKSLRSFLPGSMVEAPGEGKGCGVLSFVKEPESIGKVKVFYGSLGVVVKTLSYIMTLDREGIPEASSNAVLSANYVMDKLSGLYKMAYNETCIHEFVVALEDLKRGINVSTMDITKALLDYGIHSPIMCFPLIVHEALMVELTGIESRGTLDQAVEVFRNIYETTKTDPESLHQAPAKATVRRLDEVTAARRPMLHYMGE